MTKRPGNEEETKTGFGYLHQNCFSNGKKGIEHYISSMEVVLREHVYPKRHFLIGLNHFLIHDSGPYRQHVIRSSTYQEIYLPTYSSLG